MHFVAIRAVFKCRKVIDFASAALHGWLENLVPLFHPIRSKMQNQ